jgi:hypothetical protein
LISALGLLALLFWLAAFMAICFYLRAKIFDLAAATDSKRSDAFLVGLTLVLSAILFGLYSTVHYHFHVFR